MPEHHGHHGQDDGAAVNGPPRLRLGELLEAGLASPTAAPLPGQAADREYATPALAPHPGPGPGPADTDVAGMPGELPVSWDVISALRQQASKDIEAERSRQTLTAEDEQQMARAVITRVVGRWATTWALEHPALSREQIVVVREAVFHSIYQSGPLQRYLNDPTVENIKIYGDEVRIKHFDRPTRRVPAIADTDEGLVAWVNDMAARSGHGERQLAQGRPETNFRLPDGSRVAASLLTARPAVTIRKHRVLQYGLQDLIDWGTIDPVLASFLVACVRAKRSILFAGDMGTGKTTLLRATARQIPAEEDIATLETDYELYLDRMPDGPHVLPFEARESGGERGADGKKLGERTIADIFPGVLRHDISRVIVGEVRSVEVFPMLDAMAAGGSGAMCTLHARRPSDVLERLLFLCNRAGLSDAAASKLIASAVDVVVYLRRIDYTSRGGRQHRFVSHVLETAGVGESGRPAFTEIFAPIRGEPRAVPRQAPRCLEELVEHGDFDAGLLQHQHGQWAPMGVAS